MWCTCVYPHVYAGVLTGACTRGGQMSTSGLILSHSPTLFLRQDFPLTGSPPFGWPASPWDLPISISRETRIIDTHGRVQAFLQLLVSKLRPAGLHSKLFTY